MLSVNISTPVNISNIESLLTRIWSGELRHVQTVYFCNTACCLAGWDVVLHSDWANHPLPEDRWSYKRGPYLAPIAWAAWYNNLTSSEAWLLYSAFATKALHKAMLEGFKRGKRIKGDHRNVKWYKDTKGYCSPLILDTSREDSKELHEFFGVDSQDTHIKFGYS